MKVTIAQLNPIVGDISGNQEEVAEILDHVAGKTDLIVFPELFLVGYPPKDLLERRWFLAKVDRALEELVKLSIRYPETGILVGAPIPSEKTTGKGLYNGAVLIYQGRVILRQAKSLLPTNDVFDEARHFDPASWVAPVDFKGERLGITVCEDGWNIPEYWPICQKYDHDPIEVLAKQGATLFINISASPFYVGKDEVRYKVFGTHPAKYGIPLLFVNQVGANDELIFDGGSMLFDRQGRLTFMAPRFEETLETLDLDRCDVAVAFQPGDRVETVYQALVLGVRDYLRKSGFSRAVIGLSGGIDSALTCCLAVEALGKENVLGITMPSPFSSEGSINDSRDLATNLGIDFKTVPISGIYESYLATLDGHFAGKERDTTEENIQARIRGNILMAFSNKYGYLTLSTGNKSEMAVGYCTLYGDMSGGLSVIADVPKTMVYELARYANRHGEIIPRNIFEKPPSAELKPDQRDQDTLPPYPVLDQILYYYIEEGYSPEEIIRMNFEPDTVRWVVRMVERNEYKRKQAAPGLKVTSKAFGGGRRIPIVKKNEG